MITAMRTMERWPTSIKCALTVAAVVAAMAVQVPFESRGIGGPFFVFLAVVFVSTLMFGRICGWVSVALSAFLSTLYFDPIGSFLVFRASHLLEIELYVLVSAGAVLGAGNIRRAALAHAAQNSILAAEKDVLSLQVREAIHRASNNFSLLNALVRRSAAGDIDPKIKLGVEQASELIQSVAKLSYLTSSYYGEEDVGSKNLLTQACSDLRACAPSNVNLRCEVENYEMPLSQLKLIMLIINELVTNSFKYAFPGNRKGTIRIAFYKDRDFIRLRVEDDGVGMDGTIKGSGLGLTLLKDLAGVLNSEVEMHSNVDGTSVSVLIPCDANKKIEQFEHRAAILH